MDGTQMNNIWISASDGDIEAVRMYIRNGQKSTSKDDYGYTPIHAAAAYGYEDLLNYLLDEAEGDVNITDNDGDTPLHHCETAAMARLLIEKGAKIDAVNDAGVTPPYTAFFDGNEELVEFYMSIGVEYNVNIEEGEGMIDNE